MSNDSKTDAGFQAPRSSDFGIAQLKHARSIKTSDTSTSIIIHPDPALQIICGKVPLVTHENVMYSTPDAAEGSNLLMDILVPKNPGKKPLVVFVQVAALCLRGRKVNSIFGPILRKLVLWLQASSTGPSKTVQPIKGVADLKSAFRFLLSRAGEYSIDPTSVGVWGLSAGGYLAAMAGVTNNDKRFEIGENLDQSSSVHAVVDCYGPSDVSKADDDYPAGEQAAAGPLRRSLYVNGFLPHGGLRDLASNPVNHITPSNVGFLFFHGDQDGLISPSQTLILHNALLAGGINSKRYILKDANHGDLSFLGDSVAGLPWSSGQTMGIVVDFFRASLFA